MAMDLATFAKERGVKYFLISYTDLFGGQRAKLVPAQAITDMAADGAGFAGFATWLDLTPAHPDMFAIPDPSSVIQLPWKPQVAWLASNCVMEGTGVPHAPRNVLSAVTASAAAEGMYVKTGVEPEFFLLGTILPLQIRRQITGGFGAEKGFALLILRLRVELLHFGRDVCVG